MIDGKIKQNLIKELEKAGNIYLSCRTVNVDRSTYYRWMHSDRTFRKDAKRAIREGRDNTSDAVEYYLIKAAKDGKVEAMKYFLSRNSDRYKPGKNQVMIVHSSPDKEETKRLQEELRLKIEEASEQMRKFIEDTREDALEDIKAGRYYVEPDLPTNENELPSDV